MRERRLAHRSVHRAHPQIVRTGPGRRRAHPGVVGRIADQESGWIKIDGNVAQSTSTSILDPAFYAVLVEAVGEDRFVADLPFEKCTQSNGDLFPQANGGDLVD